MPGYFKRLSLVIFLFILGSVLFLSSPPEVSAADPLGFFDSADCSQMTGWSGDPNFPNVSNQIAIFDGGPAGSGQFIKYVAADQPRTAPVCDAIANGLTNCAVCDNDPTQPQCRHGFVYQTPDSLKDGRTHQIYVHGMHIDNQGNNPLLQLNPRSISCGNMPNGDASITATFNGFPLTIKTTNRLAGAIDSLTWNGKEFVDSVDHGRQIQTAWSVNGLGQCYNPTEAGSAADGAGGTSSSILLDFQVNGSNSYYTKSKPAFWDSPGEYDVGCNFDPNGSNGPWLGGTAVNKTIVSDWLLEKWVTIGYRGIPNVIEYISKITVPANPDVAINYIILDQPSAHLSGFPVWKQFDPISASLVPPATYYGYSNHPHVMITADGNFALSVYTTEISQQGFENQFSSLPQYPYLGYMAILLPSINLSVNGERLAKTESFTPGSTHTYVSYIVVGTPEQVRQSVQSLYSLNNPSSTPIPPTSTPIPPSLTPVPPTVTPNPPSPTPVPIPGDITGPAGSPDGVVNIYDYNKLIGDFGKTGAPGFTPSDIDKNGKVDIYDYNILIGNWGRRK